MEKLFIIPEIKGFYSTAVFYVFILTLQIKFKKAQTTRLDCIVRT